MNLHRKLLSFSQVRQYYAKFKKTGNPRTAKIEKTEFCDIMQVHWDTIDKLDIHFFHFSSEAFSQQAVKFYYVSLLLLMSETCDIFG